MDILSILGLLIGFGAIIVGQYLEGGHLDTILNAVALLIVLGGTLGAVMLQTPMNTFIRALKMTVWIFKPPQQSAKRLLDKILDWNQIARREGLLRLEAMAMEETDIFTQKGLQLIADGAEPEIIREILETDLDIMENNDLQAAKVYEAMGGYSPTIGIIGAVLGLIHHLVRVSPWHLLPPSTVSGWQIYCFYRWEINLKHWYNVAPNYK